jgi:hypothetical protein
MAASPAKPGGLPFLLAEGGSNPEPRLDNRDETIVLLDTPMEIMLPWFVSTSSSGLNSNSQPTPPS